MEKTNTLVDFEYFNGEEWRVVGSSSDPVKVVWDFLNDQVEMTWQQPS